MQLPKSEHRDRITLPKPVDEYDYGSRRKSENSLFLVTKGQADKDSLYRNVNMSLALKFVTL